MQTLMKIFCGKDENYSNLIFPTKNTVNVYYKLDFFFIKNMFFFIDDEHKNNNNNNIITYYSAQ